VVIGSGPAGEKGAAQSAYFGRKVALVERAPAVGGASGHTGTLPPKTLPGTPPYLTRFPRPGRYGMSVRLDRKKSLRQLVHRLRDVVDEQTRQIERNLDRHSIVLVPGSATFEDEHTVAVNGGKGETPRRISADVFLIATGSSPRPPLGIEIRDPDVVDSDRILELDRVPLSMTVVGGGVIGTEYACLFAALGTRITLVEGGDRLLAGVDEDLSSALRRSLEHMGAEILFGDAVESVHRVPKRRSNAIALKLKSGRQPRADKLLSPTGRTGNTRGMNLDKIGVELTDRGHTRVNEHYQTSLPHIYAAGDVIGFPALASTSMEQGRLASCHMFGRPGKMPPNLIPYGIYTIPEISMVGHTEEQLTHDNIAYEIGLARYAELAKGQMLGDEQGLLKLIFDPDSLKLLGVHAIGDRASEIVHIGQVVLTLGATIEYFRDTVFNYPTLAEAYKVAALDGLNKL